MKRLIQVFTDLFYSAEVTAEDKTYETSLQTFSLYKQIQLEKVVDIEEK